jgi:hypothetical protein
VKLEIGGQLRPLTKTPLSEAQILALLQEVADPASLSFESYTDDVVASLERLGPETVAVGHGMGDRFRPGGVFAAFPIPVNKSQGRPRTNGWCNSSYLGIARRRRSPAQASLSREGPFVRPTSSLGLNPAPFGWAASCGSRTLNRHSFHPSDPSAHVGSLASRRFQKGASI